MQNNLVAPIINKNLKDAFYVDFPHLMIIDTQLNQLVKKIELLNYINPINIDQEKKKFFLSKYNTNPVFRYKKIDFDAHKLQQLLFSQPLDKIEDTITQNFYREVIYDYSGLIQCIETIGKQQSFYFNSLKSFGTPTQKDVSNAEFILHFEDDHQTEEMHPKFSVDEAVHYFKQFMSNYNFPLQISISKNLSAAAMVQNSTQTLVLKKNHQYSANQLKVLAHHEIGVHLVTTYNGMNQPLSIFHNGFPKYVETQEGLAVFSEYMSGCLTLHRLKELSFRVLAADSLRKGFEFRDTFDLLYNQHKLNREEAFNVTLRAHRGGGFTKDYLYLTGLKKVYDYHQKEGNLDVLMSGKATIEHHQTVAHWKQIGFCQDNKFNNMAFVENQNKSAKIDFILDNLK